MSFIVGDKPYTQKMAPLFVVPPKHLTVELDQLESLHVIGSPGEGKSTFLGRLADACIDEGEGVLLIDPKGDLARDVALKTRHADKLIYIAPGADSRNCFTMNVLEVPENHTDRETYQDIVGGNLLRMFEHMGRFDPAFMAMIATYLRVAVKTAYTEKNPTLVDVIFVLMDQYGRAELVNKTRRPDIKFFWEYYQKRTPMEQRSQVDSTLRRLWEFILDTNTRTFIANPTSTVHLADWLNVGKLVVVNLAQGLHEDDAERIGNLMVAYLTTQYRLRESELVPWDKSRRWRLIVDEFHRFSARPFAQIIREGRSANFFPSWRIRTWDS
jgi:energy-coupling factor transporter ATP-binding protein EcfA2